MYMQLWKLLIQSLGLWLLSTRTPIPNCPLMLAEKGVGEASYALLGLLLSCSCRQDSYFSQFRLVNPKLKPNLVQLMHSLYSLLSSITLFLRTPILYSYSYSHSSHSLLSSITLFSAPKRIYQRQKRSIKHQKCDIHSRTAKSQIKKVGMIA